MGAAASERPRGGRGNLPSALPEFVSGRGGAAAARRVARPEHSQRRAAGHDPTGGGSAAARSPRRAASAPAAPAPASPPVAEKPKPPDKVAALQPIVPPAEPAPAPPRRDLAMVVPPVAVPPAAGDDRGFQDCPTCVRMVRVPAGSFMMGQGAKDPSAAPAHKVVLRAFALSQYPVTVAEWNACHADGGCGPLPRMAVAQDDTPIHNVSWDDAQTFIAWLSRRAGHAYRLPTEAEWEYAARAGTTSRYWWGDQPGTALANCAGCGGTQDPRAPLPVGTFQPNPSASTECSAASRNGCRIAGSRTTAMPRRRLGAAVAELHEARAARRFVPCRARRYRADRRAGITMLRCAIWRTASGWRATSIEAEARPIAARCRRRTLRAHVNGDALGHHRRVVRHMIGIAHQQLQRMGARRQLDHGLGLARARSAGGCGRWGSAGPAAAAARRSTGGGGRCSSW